MNKNKRNVINQMTLESIDDKILDVLQEQELETKPSRAVKNHSQFAHSNKKRYEKPRNPRYFEDFND